MHEQKYCEKIQLTVILEYNPRNTSNLDNSYKQHSYSQVKYYSLFILQHYLPNYTKHVIFIALL